MQTNESLNRQCNTTTILIPTPSFASPAPRAGLHLFILMLLFTSSTAFAQLKVLNGGKVGIGTTDVLGTKVHITSDLENMCLLLSHGDSSPWNYIAKFNGAHSWTKALAISQYGMDNSFFLCNGQGWSTGQYIFSDGRMKTKVVDIDDPIGKIMKLRGVYYHYKPLPTYSKALGLSANDTIRHIGFIAQELKLVIPEVVDATQQGTLGINYPQLVALLTAGLQQQQGQINDLEARLNTCCGKKPMPKGDPTKKDTLLNLGKKMGATETSSGYILYQNQPNPFHANTSIAYQTPEDAKGVSILLFNMQGELLKTYANLQAGKNSLSINAYDLKPGMYLYSLVCNGTEIDTKRMILSE
ncbi:MAG: hypothetical protein CFE21_02185 [Bacteroidetes bacterium B1(2017)]|nr:MAG: hypothetical protein CFE21_02185 [Bacteroidetes bacterium B1(2017)]